MENSGGNPSPGGRRSPSSSDRFLGIVQPGISSATAAPTPLELSEHDIFDLPSESRSPTKADHSRCPCPRPRPRSRPRPRPRPRLSLTPDRRNIHGVLAALDDDTGIGSGSSTGPVFNYKASPSIFLSPSLSSSSSISPDALSSGIVIPARPHPASPKADRRMRLGHQSLPVNVPVIHEAMQRRTMEIGQALAEEGEQGDEVAAPMVPPHEVLAARRDPMSASSMLEGAGRTLKGRDLRKVRNAVWRKTGFLDETID